jgi:predicted nucleic acid-binding Zn ribbon protein
MKDGAADLDQIAEAPMTSLSDAARVKSSPPLVVSSRPPKVASRRKPCPGCGFPVNKDLRICPNCGRNRLRVIQRRIGWLATGLLALIFVAFIIVALNAG